MSLKWLLTLLLAGLAASAVADEPAAVVPAKPTPDAPAFRLFLETHCLSCHDQTNKAAGLDLEAVGSAGIDQNVEVWEKVVRKLTARQMPPKKSPRPGEGEYNSAVAVLESSLDALAAKSPNPGRTETLRRLNRTEYQNTIRDLLALDIDVSSL